MISSFPVIISPVSLRFDHGSLDNNRIGGNMENPKENVLDCGEKDIQQLDASLKEIDVVKK